MRGSSLRPESGRIQKRLVTLLDAQRIASRGFQVPPTPAFAKDVEEHLQDSDLAYVLVAEDGSDVGFGLFKKLTPELLYLAGIQIVPEYQGFGYARQMIALAFMETETRFLGFRTQSAIMWSSVARVTRGISPHPTSAVSEAVVAQATLLAGLIGCSGAPISPQFYGGPLYGRKPIHRSVAVQKWWDSLCRFEQGDAMVCVAER